MKINKEFIILISSLLACFTCSTLFAQDLTLPALSITSNNGATESVSVSLQVLAVMTALTMLPALILTMTSFTRVIIVLAILRQAIGMPQTPSNQILIGLAFFLSLFIMAPTFYKINDNAIQPYIEEKIDYHEALSNAREPIVDFMLAQTRKTDLGLFESLGKQENVQQESKLPISIIVPAFITSELKTAFQIGFLIFLPFLIIDLVVASVLMSMGMMMLSPLIISLPFKVMLFVLIDGWTLVTSTLASSFG